MIIVATGYPRRIACFDALDPSAPPIEIVPPSGDDHDIGHVRVVSPSAGPLIAVSDVPSYRGQEGPVSIHILDFSRVTLSKVEEDPVPRVHRVAELKGLRNKVTSFCPIPGTDLIASAEPVGGGQPQFDYHKLHVDPALMRLRYREAPAPCGDHFLTNWRTGEIVHRWGKGEGEEGQMIALQTTTQMFASPDVNQVFFVGDSSFGIISVDLETLKVVNTYSVLEGAASSVNAAAIGTQGSVIYSCSSDQKVRMWDRRKSNISISTETGSFTMPGRFADSGHSLYVVSDKNILIVVDQVSNVHLFDTRRLEGGVPIQDAFRPGAVGIVGDTVRVSGTEFVTCTQSRTAAKFALGGKVTGEIKCHSSIRSVCSALGSDDGLFVGDSPTAYWTKKDWEENVVSVAAEEQTTE